MIGEARSSSRRSSTSTIRRPSTSPSRRTSRRSSRRAATRSRASVARRSPAAPRRGALGARARHVPAASLGPVLDIDPFFRTPWQRGRRLVDEPAGRCARTTIEQKDVLHRLSRGRRPRAARRAARRRPARPGASCDLPAGRGRAGRREGIVAYSKICTHAGCAISLYRKPTFAPVAAEAGARLPVPLLDVRPGARRRACSSGPAGRPLPQLPLGIDGDGQPARGRQLLRAGRPVLVGRPQPEAEAVIRRAVRFARPAHRHRAVRPARRCATSSPTTGRSCSARSRSTRSSSSSATGIYLTLFFDPSVATRSSTTARTRRCRARQMTQAYRSVVRPLAST